MFSLKSNSKLIEETIVPGIIGTATPVGLGPDRCKIKGPTNLREFSHQELLDHCDKETRGTLECLDILCYPTQTQLENPNSGVREHRLITSSNTYY